MRRAHEHRAPDRADEWSRQFGNTGPFRALDANTTRALGATGDRPVLLHVYCDQGIGTPPSYVGTLNTNPRAPRLTVVRVMFRARSTGGREWLSLTLGDVQNGYSAALLGQNRAANTVARLVERAGVLETVPNPVEMGMGMGVPRPRNPRPRDPREFIEAQLQDLRDEIVARETLDVSTETGRILAQILDALVEKARTSAVLRDYLGLGRDGRVHLPRLDQSAKGLLLEGDVVRDENNPHTRFESIALGIFGIYQLQTFSWDEFPAADQPAALHAATGFYLNAPQPNWESAANELKAVLFANVRRAWRIAQQKRVEPLLFKRFAHPFHNVRATIEGLVTFFRQHAVHEEPRAHGVLAQAQPDRAQLGPREQQQRPVFQRANGARFQAQPGRAQLQRAEQQPRPAAARRNFAGTRRYHAGDFDPTPPVAQKSLANDVHIQRRVTEFLDTVTRLPCLRQDLAKLPRDANGQFQLPKARPAIVVEGENGGLQVLSDQPAPGEGTLLYQVCTTAHGLHQIFVNREEILRLPNYHHDYQQNEAHQLAFNVSGIALHTQGTRLYRGVPHQADAFTAMVDLCPEALLTQFDAAQVRARKAGSDEPLEHFVMNAFDVSDVCLEARLTRITEYKPEPGLNVVAPIESSTLNNLSELYRVFTLRQIKALCQQYPPYAAKVRNRPAGALPDDLGDPNLTRIWRTSFFNVDLFERYVECAVGSPLGAARNPRFPVGEAADWSHMESWQQVLRTNLGHVFIFE